MRTSRVPWCFLPYRRSANQQARLQLIEADVDIGFGLVDEVRAYRLSGQTEFGIRALAEAVEILADIEVRLRQIGVNEAGPFQPLLNELRQQIASVISEQA